MARLFPFFGAAPTIALTFELVGAEQQVKQDFLQVFLHIREGGASYCLPINLSTAWFSPFGLFLTYRTSLAPQQRFKVFVLKSDSSYKQLRFLLSSLSYVRLEQRLSDLRAWRCHVLG